MCNLPVLTKCCCCIPLRQGLIVWGYFRLIITITYLSLISFEACSQYSAKGLAILLALLSFLVANLVFTVAFIVGTHKKNYKLLRIYYSFSIFSLIVIIMGYFIFITLQVALTLQDEEKYILGFPLIAVNISTVTSIALDLYFLILVKIEILKLRNQRAYYVNGTQGTTSFALDSVVKENKRCDSVYSDLGSEEDIAHKNSMFPMSELESVKKHLENRRL